MTEHTEGIQTPSQARERESEATGYLLIKADRLMLLERLLTVEYDMRYQMLSKDEHKALACEADEIVETLARMEAEAE